MHDHLPEDLSFFKDTELSLLPEVMNSDYFRDHLQPALRQRHRLRVHAVSPACAMQNEENYEK